MAATLDEGREYGLASNVSTSGNKTFIHFKLTDSALRALEEYSKIKGGCSRKPTIQFRDSNGVMSIPGQVSSDDPKAERSFKLNLAKIHGDVNGSFDCIQQTSTGQGSSLQCLGSMQFKVTTHANNDVYNDTRKKIAFADTESKKFCAKEIKMSGRFSGKKIKKVIPSSQYKALNPTPKPSPASISTSSSSLVNNRLTPPPSSAHSPHHPINGNRNKPVSALGSSNGVMKPSGHSGNKGSSATTGLPYRERVIHLLALRPYKKPELVARLMKDGIKDKDRNILGVVLKSVGTMNKDNSYSLAKHVWQDIRSDWPLYTDADRQLMKKNQQLMESRPSLSPSVSPAVRPSNSPSPPQKRSLEDLPDVVPNKKQRISHHDKHQKRTNGKLADGDNNNHNSSSGAVTMATNSFGDKGSPGSNRENQEKDDDTDSTPDYVTQYSGIESCKQRLRYKQDFNSEYEEYRRLHEKVQNVTRRFQHLKERILNTKEGSQEFEELRSKVLQEYEQQKNDSKFLQRKQRVNYLHGKLGHIKRLIMEYDRNQHIADCS
ncbi:RNA polymerase II elongation factor ELL-like [Littorina saxatilis]|uniref:OCEL domain-containing protein n=1 Tax=Littorina saxatilis TaxID=31220 RepID=A0AAN9GS05_9CAEN